MEPAYNPYTRARRHSPTNCADCYSGTKNRYPYHGDNYYHAGYATPNKDDKK